MRRDRSTLLGIALALVCTACGPRHSATPEDLRRAWAKSLRDDDPEAAWALLSPQAQARIGKEAFMARWERDAGDRKAALQASKDLSGARATPVLGGRTTHPGGETLTWVRLGDGYYVSSGLPTRAWTITAEGTIRAFVAQLRRLADAKLDHLVSPELLERVSDAWAERADAIEAALERPGSLELSAAYDRAVLRYEGGAIVLERTDAGWRVLDMR